MTEAGHCFLEYVNSAFSMIEEGVSQAKQIANRSSQQLRVASAFGMLRDLAGIYSAEHPEYEIKLTICDTEEIRQMLIKNEADIGLNLGPIPDVRLANRILMKSRFFVAVNEDNPLANQRSVTLKDLEDQMLFCSNIAQTYECAQEIFRKAGCRCNLLRLDERDVLFQAARKGLGHVFFMPMLSENKETPESIQGLATIPIRDCTEKGQVVMMMRKDAYFPAEAEEFVSFLAKCYYEIEEYTKKMLSDRNIDPEE